MPDALRALSIFGTRPEAIKMAPVIQRLSETPSVESIVCITAQHREMLDQVLDLFDIHPDYDLDIMVPAQPLNELTANVFQGLDPVIESVQPDWVLVQGDTTTVMSAALLAYYHRVKVGHVEAGLRTGDKYQPFPEEINRRVLGAVADLHFAPTAWAQGNLLRESVPPKKIVVTGNTVIDALNVVIERPVDLFTGPLAGLEHETIILVTAHRRENFGDPMERIFWALREIAQHYEGSAHLIYPVHLNPRVQEPAKRILSGVPNIHLIEPLAYLPMVHLIRRAHIILTDSGGIQEEAPGLGTPVLVLRERTERPEAIEAGTAILVGTDKDRIVNETRRLMDDEKAHAAMATAVNPFGDGHAAERIVEGLLAAEGEPA
ncbi:MAG: UDP-N-acetylglucosamine 2-epimerase (non-hydrolyzing) [Chloroflexi bacterium]|nr:UDP-N-acetylglucosamine 2-epimerase (non-hydrolyzing) [Chloroflexota bacterium]